MKYTKRVYLRYMGPITMQEITSKHTSGDIEFIRVPKKKIPAEINNITGENKFIIIDASIDSNSDADREVHRTAMVPMHTHMNRVMIHRNGSKLEIILPPHLMFESDEETK